MSAWTDALTGLLADASALETARGLAGVILESER